MTVSKAAQKASKKYQDKACDNILVRFPKGIKDKIKSTGVPVNGYINRAVKEQLERDAK